MKYYFLIISLITSISTFCQTNWTLSNNGIPNGYSPNDFALDNNADVYLAASQWNGTSFSPKLLKSTDNGNSWTEIIMNGLTNVQNTNSIIFSGGKLLLAGSNSSNASYYVYSSTDNGLNWSLSNTGITSGYSPNALALAPNGDVYLVASQWNGSSFSPKLLKSTNSGSVWTEITMSGLSNVNNTNSIIFSGSNLLLSGSSSTGIYYVYTSSDNGLNWTLSNLGIPSGYSLNDFVVTTGQEIYAACSQWNGSSFSPKIIKSTNSGLSWTEITGLTGLTNLQNTNSIIYSGSNLLLSGSNSSTSSYFVFKSNMQITGIKNEKNGPSYSIFPNPFSFQTTLQSEKPLTDATFTIYNLMGQQVLQIKNINGKIIAFNRDKLTSGVYFFYLTQDNNIFLTDKLIITD